MSNQRYPEEFKMGYRLRWPKKNLTHCPGWVDHYRRFSTKRMVSFVGLYLAIVAAPWLVQEAANRPRTVQAADCGCLWILNS